MPKSIEDLPPEIRKEISSHLPTIQDKTNSILDRKTRTLFQPDAILSKFLEFVAHGKQEHAEKIFTIRKKNPEQLQELLLARGTMTDYSGRTFTNISAYEYAYWAKDTHMCRMLEKHMDADTKAAMLKRCDAIEKNGLTYKQHGVEVKGSKHFDFTPLITALQDYVNGYDNWSNNSNWTAFNAAWMKVGIAQRDVPAHIVNEYCRTDRSFDPLPQFNEKTLPRSLTFYNWATRRDEVLFPCSFSASDGLGVNFALLRGKPFPGDRGAMAGRGLGPWGVCLVASPYLDLAAVSRLDEVRTQDLTQSRENLKGAEPSMFFYN